MTDSQAVPQVAAVPPAFDKEGHQLDTEGKPLIAQGKPAPVPNALPARAAIIPMRARFVTSEITHTTRGVTVLKLEAAFDGSIPKGNRLAVGNAPIGTITVETNQDWAAANVAHGTVFYLSSVPVSGPVA